MIIRKTFTAEMGHLVRNCSSARCKYSEHGHSAKIELFFQSMFLDNAQMVMDFGLMKGTIKEFIDSMDHCYLFCTKDDPEFISFHKKYDERWIGIPFNPSAEMLSLFVYHYVNTIIQNTNYANGELGIKLEAVRYHETASGYAECDYIDEERLWSPFYSENTIFSEGVTKDWSQPLYDCIFKNKPIQNEEVEQQIKL